MVLGGRLRTTTARPCTYATPCPAGPARAVASGNDPSELLGREEPRRRLAVLISNARNGIGGSLVIRGDPGVGKTALLGGRAVRRPARSRPAQWFRGRGDRRLRRSPAVRDAVGTASGGVARSASPGRPGRDRIGRRTTAGSLPGGSRRAGPARGGRAARPAPVRRRRRPLAGSRITGRADVRGSAAAGRVGGGVVREPQRPGDGRSAGRSGHAAARGTRPGGGRRVAEQIPGLLDRSRGGRSHRPGHRRQPVGLDRSRPRAVDRRADRLEPGGRTAPGGASPRRALRPPGAAAAGIGPDLAADRGRGLDREPRADRPGGPAGRRRRRGGRCRRPGPAGRSGPCDPIPASAGPRRGLQRGLGYGASPCPRRAVRGGRRSGTVRSRSLARRQGAGRDERRGGPAAGAGRRPGRSAGRQHVPRQRARPGGGADPAGSAAERPASWPPRRRRWRPGAPRSVWSW